MKKHLQTSDDQKPRKKARQEASKCDAENRCDKSVLSDDDLEQVSAAGETTVPTMDPEVLLGRHARPDNTEENRP